MLTKIFNISRREIGLIIHNPIYWFCMILFPILVTVFFTSLMDAGQPQEMPIGVVDLDNTTTTRTLIRRLDAFQTSKVKKHYASFEEARKAMQSNEIYAFIYHSRPHGIQATKDIVLLQQCLYHFRLAYLQRLEDNINAGLSSRRHGKTIGNRQNI